MKLQEKLGCCQGNDVKIMKQKVYLMVRLCVVGQRIYVRREMEVVGFYRLYGDGVSWGVNVGFMEQSGQRIFIIERYGSVGVEE